MSSQSFNKINVYVTVSRQSISYYDYCIKNYGDLSSQLGHINFVAVCIEDVSGLLSTFDRKLVVPQVNSSVTHALAINAALHDLDQCRDTIGIFADSDTVMLQSGWDDTIKELLSIHDIIGCEYEDINGFSSGAGNVQTYKKLPTATWFAVRPTPKVSWSELDMSLGNVKQIKICSEEQSRMYNLPIGYFVYSGEVGWRIPEFIHNHGLSCFTFVQTKPTKTAKIVRTGNDYHEEFQLADGTPFIAHQRGSRKHAFKSQPLSAPFYDACEAHLKMLAHKQ